MEQLVSPDPEVTCIERDEQDNYMMVACDGIYDVMENDQLKDFISERYTSGNGSFFSCGWSLTGIFQ